MQSYAVIETDDGMTVIEVDGTDTLEHEAERYRGVVADPTLYATYEDAYDALLIIDAEAHADESRLID